MIKFKLTVVCCLAVFLQPPANASDKNVSLVVLGVAQDAGYPQINCYKPHCMPGWKEVSKRRLATSIAVIDHSSKEKFLFEATPDIKQQFYQLHLLAPDNLYKLSAILLTHAHMGHYTGLMHLGREAAGSASIPLYVMPKMAKFLTKNGPWSQLVQLNNVLLKPLANNQPQSLNKRLVVTPFLVPHRDEYSETVGFKITGPNKSVLFIPDIDKWQKWSINVIEQIKEVDYAFLDATFFNAGELPNRDMSEVPHPFVEESMDLFSKLSKKEKQKIIFIHFNHSNPLLMEGSAAQQLVLRSGFRFAKEGLTLSL